MTGHSLASALLSVASLVPAIPHSAPVGFSLPFAGKPRSPLPHLRPIWKRRVRAVKFLVLNSSLLPVLQVGPWTACRSGAHTPVWPFPACSWCASSGGALRSALSLQVCLRATETARSPAATFPELARSFWIYLSAPPHSTGQV